MHVPDPEHLLPVAHPGKCHRLSEPVWEHESHSDRRSGASGDGGEHGCGDCVLQDKIFHIGLEWYNTSPIAFPLSPGFRPRYKKI